MVKSKMDAWKKGFADQLALFGLTSSCGLAPVGFDDAGGGVMGIVMLKYDDVPSLQTLSGLEQIIARNMQNEYDCKLTAIFWRQHPKIARQHNDAKELPAAEIRTSGNFPSYPPDEKSLAAEALDRQREEMQSFFDSLGKKEISA